MTVVKAVAVAAVAVGLGLALSGRFAPAVARAADAPPATQPGAPKKVKILFRPNATDAPASRIGGASRAPRQGGEPPPWVSVLAPQERVGTTTSDQPALYWYLSGETKSTVVLTLTPMGPDGKDQTGKNIMVVAYGGRKNPPVKAGIHRLDLKAEKDVDGKPIRLEPNIHYEWTVKVEVQRVGGSNNPSANCRIQRIAPPAALADVSKLPPDEAAERYAGAGVFLDALAALNDAIDAGRADKDDLLAQRREFLALQGLIESKPGQIDEPAKGEKVGDAGR